MPLVSVITVVYNNVKGIEPTILSVLPHLGNDVEYVVIDGGSTDGTVDVIRKYEKQIAYWVTERDRGIYDALNKGTAAAKGTYITTINVGDRLVAVPLESLRKALAEKADVAMFGVDVGGRKIFRSEISSRIRYCNTIHHQGAYYLRNADLAYNTQYKVYADFDLNQRYFKARKKFIAFEQKVSTHDDEGSSIHRKNFPEYYRVAKDNFGPLFSFLAKVYHNYSLIMISARKSLRQLR